MEQIRLDRQPSVGTDVFRGPTRPAGSAPSTGVECGSVHEVPPLPQGENSWGGGHPSTSHFSAAAQHNSDLCFFK